MTSKTCNKCGETKSLEAFTRNRTFPDGHSYHCKTCRRRQRKKLADAQKQSPPTPPAFKVCCQCDKKKPQTEFYKLQASKSGLSSACKKCLTAKAKEVYIPGQHRDISLRHRFGIDSKQYESMLKIQGGKCAICGADNPRRVNQKYFHVDHNHVTGEIRGLLCHHCNAGIGFLDDDPERLEAATKYLREHDG